MASVKPNYNKKTGEIISYRFRACLGRDDFTGKQEFTTKTVPAPVGLTPAKALKQMQTEADVWENEIRKGNAPAKRDSFRFFIEEQFIPVHVCNGKHSPATVKFYKDICEKLVERFGTKNLDAVKSIDIERYLVDLTKQKYKRGKNGPEQAYSATYINHFRRVLTVAFDFAERHGLIERNPMRFISAVKSERKEVDFLTKEEALKFLACLNKDASLYWKTAMNLIIRDGLRRGELAGLKWEDINYSDNTLTVCRDVINNAETGFKNFVKETKSVHSDRILPLDPVMMKLLKLWKAEQDELYGATLMPTAYIFGQVFTSSNVERKQEKRAELYKKVWEKPVSQVAAEYGLSDNAIRKRCIYLNVPLPEKGYWAKVKAGKQVSKPELPEFTFDSDTNDPYSPIRPDSITQWLSRFNKQHGLRNVSPHDLRHTCATLLLSSGASVKETQMIMGHADASTTLKLYVGADSEALRNASDRLSQVLAIGE